MLRAIRFAVRCGFELAADLLAAATSREVHEALLSKVSRERVGKELEGMLTGKNAKPGKALEMIWSFGMQNVVFSFPEPLLSGRVVTFVNDDNCLNCSEEPEGPSLDNIYNGWKKSRQAISLITDLSNVVENSYLIRAPEKSTFATLDYRLLHLCLCLLPFRQLTYIDSKKKVQSVVSYVIGQSLKYKKVDVANVALIIDLCTEMAKIVENYHRHSKFPDRLEIGLLLRKLKTNWPTCLATSVIYCSLQTDTKMHQEIFRVYVVFVDEICVNLDLDECWKRPPLLNGNQISKLLGLKNGPKVGYYIKKQINWMLLNPHGSKEECAQYICKIYDEEHHATKRTASQASL